MQKNQINRIFWLMPCLVLGLSSLFFTACDEDEINGSIIEMPESDMWDTTEIGRYIYENFTKPYNIRVVYRWEDGRQDMGKNLTPVKEEKMKPFLSMLKTVWMDPYVEFLDSADFAKFTIKEMLVIGSPSLNESGTVTKGFAEGGRQIYLYDVNSLSPENVEEFVMYFHTMHHEFAHILQQNNKDYDGEYRVLSKGLYTSAWSNTTNDVAREEGFITAYSKAKEDEDFVEILSVKLVNSPAAWNYLIDETIKSDASRKIIREKERIVDEWMMNVWGIDVDKFQDAVYKAIKAELQWPEERDYIHDGNFIIGEIINGEVELY